LTVKIIYWKKYLPCMLLAPSEQQPTNFFWNSISNPDEEKASTINSYIDKAEPDWYANGEKTCHL